MIKSCSQITRIAQFLFISSLQFRKLNTQKLLVVCGVKSKHSDSKCYKPAKRLLRFTISPSGGVNLSKRRSNKVTDYKHRFCRSSTEFYTILKDKESLFSSHCSSKWNLLKNTNQNSFPRSSNSVDNRRKKIKPLLSDG